MSSCVVSAGSRPSSERPSCTPTPSLGGRTTPSSASSLLRPSTADTRCVCEREIEGEIERALLYLQHVSALYIPAGTKECTSDTEYWLHTPTVWKRILKTSYSIHRLQSLWFLAEARLVPFVRGRRERPVLLAPGKEEGDVERVLKLLHVTQYNVYVGVCRNQMKVSSLSL